MAEYIQRTDVEEMIKEQFTLDDNDLRYIKQMVIDKLPSIDIVTCENCKYWKHIEGCSFCGSRWGLYKETAEDDYCVRGEEE